MSKKRTGVYGLIHIFFDIVCIDRQKEFPILSLPDASYQNWPTAVKIEESEIYSLKKKATVPRGRIQIFLKKELCACLKPLMSIELELSVMHHEVQKR